MDQDLIGPLRVASESVSRLPEPATRGRQESES